VDQALLSRIRVSGALIFLASTQFLLGMLLAESLYPGYSVSLNYISDLGATCRTTCAFVQPSSLMFDSSVFLLGALLVIGAYLFRLGSGSVLSPLLLGVTGLGAMGVGVFPETAGMLHPVVSLVAFMGGGLAALSTFKHSKPVLCYFAAILSAMTLVALVLFATGIYLGLGAGGMERMIAFPIIIWGIAFGGYLTARTEDSFVKR
jgi:hypothetical membrane protein